MQTVRVSPKYQIVIPLEIRQSLGIRPGEKLQILLFHDRIEYIPLKKIKKMRGFLKGLDTRVPRDPDRV